MCEMKAELVIFGGLDFRPGDVQAQIGLEPDEIHYLGDSIGRSALKYESNLWVLSTGYHECSTTSECLDPLLRRLRPIWNKLRSPATASAEMQLSLAAYVGDEMPELNFDAELVKLLGAIGASLDIDIIPLGNIASSNKVQSSG